MFGSSSTTSSVNRGIRCKTLALALEVDYAHPCEYVATTMRYSASWWLRWLPLALALALLAGCPAPKYPSCDGDKDCKEGEFCVNKKCVQCSEDSQCGEGTICQANACVPKPGWCKTTDDCPNREACIDNQCVACSSDDQCAPGARCSDGQCLREGQCAVNEDCADDEDCIDGVCKFAGIPDGSQEGLCELQTVYFEFDAASIPESSRTALDENAACLKERPELGIYLVGHTDPRGTVEYNIALSDGRARAVGDYLARLGIDPARFNIVPKGEAEAEGSDEASWVEDRRVDVIWKQ